MSGTGDLLAAGKVQRRLNDELEAALKAWWAGDVSAAAPRQPLPRADYADVQAGTGSWPMKKDDYTKEARRGGTSMATVYKALCISRKEFCAIKCINLQKCHASAKELLNEIKAMKTIAHKNVLNYFVSFVHKEELWVVTSFSRSGSMRDILKRKIKKMGKEQAAYGVLDEATIATVLKEVLSGLQHIHSSDHIHRDIKAGNILLASNETVKIADFGVSGWLTAKESGLSRQKVRHTFVGTPYWMAPEVMEQVQGYDSKADIWSFGILCIELATGTAPYCRFSPMKAHQSILLNDPPTLETSAERKDQYKAYGKRFRGVIEDCLQQDPKKRPTAAQLLKNSFFGKANAKLVHTLIEDVGIDALPFVPEPKGVASGKLKKDKDGNWKFEYDSPDPLESAPENTVQSGQNERPTTSTTVQQKSESDTLNFVLRVRNQQRGLDIEFDYSLNTDSVDKIVHELVSDGLIAPADYIVLAAKLQELIDREKNRGNKSILFTLNSGLQPPNEYTDAVLSRIDRSKRAE